MDSIDHQEIEDKQKECGSKKNDEIKIECSENSEEKMDPVIFT